MEDLKSMILIGYIGRSELQYLIGRLLQTFHLLKCILEKAKVNKKAHRETVCRFTLDTGDEPEILTNIGMDDEDDHDMLGSSEVIDFGPYMDQTPITVHPKLYLETVMDMFKQLGYIQ